MLEPVANKTAELAVQTLVTKIEDGLELVGLVRASLLACGTPPEVVDGLLYPEEKGLSALAIMGEIILQISDHASTEKKRIRLQNELVAAHQAASTDDSAGAGGGAGAGGAGAGANEGHVGSGDGADGAGGAGGAGGIGGAGGAGGYWECWWSSRVQLLRAQIGKLGESLREMREHGAVHLAQEGEIDSG